MSDTVRLHDEELCSKWGFSDGDLLDDLVYEVLGPDRYDSFDDHAVLVGLVSEFLLPLLPGATLYRIGTCHNPVRLETWYGETVDWIGGTANAELPGVWVDVPETVIRERILALANGD